MAVGAGLIIRYISVSDQHKQETIHVPTWNKKKVSKSQGYPDNVREVVA